MKTLFLDIDGCIFRGFGELAKIVELPFPPQEDYLLPGVREKFHEWYFNNYNIVLTTGRPESMREQTIAQLQYFGLHYDHLIMGLKHCHRTVINDSRPDAGPTASVVILDRNKGMENLEV